MNKTEWDKLSSRQRDALVAEKVMGWKWARLNRTDKVLHLMPAEWFSGRYNFPADDQTLAEIPKADNGDGGQLWTTKIECAWLVVERIQAAGKGYLSLDYQSGFPPNLDEFFWKARFRNCRNDLEAIAKTAPEAICLAALMAIEGLKL